MEVIIQEWAEKFSGFRLPLVIFGLAVLFFFDDLLLVLLVEKLELFNLNGAYYYVAEFGLFFLSVGLALAAFRALRTTPVTGKEGLAGGIGHVVQIDDQILLIKIHGEIWQAECQDPLQIDDPVRTLSVNGLVLTVEKITE